jgi:hypothetical protein
VSWAAHNFLILCGLFAVLPAFIFVVRADLRKIMAVTVPASLPFAATEFLFYPSYWRPKFLFDLADRIGFGLEDLLFVSSLGALTSTLYPFATRHTTELPPRSKSGLALVRRAAIPLFVALLATAVLYFLGVRMIYGSCLIMAGVTAAILVVRRDLIVPAFTGAALTCVVYGALCLVFAAIIPRVFELAWNMEKFSNVFLLGVPLEELLYAASTGLVGTVFYPYVTGARFVGLPRRGSAPRPRANA